MFQCPHKYRGGEWRFYTGCCSECWEMLFLTTAALTRINPCCSEYYTDSKVCPLEHNRERSGNKHPVKMFNFSGTRTFAMIYMTKSDTSEFFTMLGLHVWSFNCIGRHQCNLISLNRERKFIKIHKKVIKLKQSFPPGENLLHTALWHQSQSRRTSSLLYRHVCSSAGGAVGSAAWRRVNDVVTLHSNLRGFGCITLTLWFYWTKCSPPTGLDKSSTSRNNPKKTQIMQSLERCFISK